MLPVQQHIKQQLDPICVTWKTIMENTINKISSTNLNETYQNMLVAENKLKIMLQTMRSINNYLLESLCTCTSENWNNLSTTLYYKLVF